MLKSRGGTTFTGLGVLAFLAANLNAQPSETVPVDLDIDIGACLELETREAQVACYGELVADQLAEQAGQPADADAASASPVAAEASRAERRAARRAERDRQEELLAQTGDVVTATVTSLREFKPNHLVITLDNDQIWRQNRPERYALQVGNEVTLRSSPWGPSYRLTDPNRGGFIQVERVR